MKQLFSWNRYKYHVGYIGHRRSLQLKCSLPSPPDTLFLPHTRMLTRVSLSKTNSGSFARGKIPSFFRSLPFPCSENFTKRCHSQLYQLSSYVAKPFKLRRESKYLCHGSNCWNVLSQALVLGIVKKK